MKLVATLVTALSLLTSGVASVQTGGAAAAADASRTATVQGSQTIKITRSGSQQSSEGPAEHFTGSARIDPLFSGNTPSHTSGGRITFQPGSRTAWHSHPLGQTLIVTAGRGRVQQWGSQIEEIEPKNRRLTACPETTRVLQR